MPLLASFTHEDREAKGLRAFSVEDAGRARPVHFTAAEMVFMFPNLLLHAPHGGGKTGFAELLAACGGDRARCPDLARAAFRNAEGDRLAQDIPETLPSVVFCGEGDDADGMLARALEEERAPLLFIVDALETRADPEALLTRLLDAAASAQTFRLLVLCETIALEGMRRPASLPEYRLLGLSRAERAAMLEPYGLDDPCAGRDYVLPGLWRLSLETDRCVSEEQAGRIAPASAAWADDYRLAADLAEMSTETLVAAVVSDPRQWSGPLRLYCNWAEPGTSRAAALAKGLAGVDSGVDVLLCAGALCAPNSAEADHVTARLVAAVNAGGAPAGLRRRAGETLARLGDPRDLEELVAIPAGEYDMGGTIHPNSEPPHRAAVGSVKIGRYPVVNAAYRLFVEETGRVWTSATGRLAERASHPATDLSWHDARAYCTWLTALWRRQDRIASDEVVRLPDEREWEAAARGPHGKLYPWGNDWAPEHANGEETGFNDICAVGLFPEGRSDFGCEDMAGQAWEWCTTLWGPDMSRPDYAFPWADDGREALDAPANIRRVLRGGCFSSPDWKANGVYRGSLEPAGSWRGNGFRIVVSR
ncbi:formylglycine-generating enzyme family protein [Martelella radicis]|uniref:Iron(II)-dependent oxidoreductase n=1 Tax=Martelella radicis TaxID=1397476 RepID=A0A7W6KK61_9HYPH|nr:SUMF1/EgtB/PvdO family nonheme iron enzyme [Martelella radicis]MBB4122597.1 iron(II)-dependent oxidoreductase [Martelella radicis]